MLILARVINRGLYWQTPKVTSSVSLASDVNKWCFDPEWLILSPVSLPGQRARS
jgi:hypothetical protein